MSAVECDVGINYPTDKLCVLKHGEVRISNSSHH